MALPSREVDNRMDEERFSSRGGWWAVGFVRLDDADLIGWEGVESTSCRRWCAEVVISGSGSS